MSIKVQIPTGTSTATVSGLFQWDYGQELEIECEEIGSELLEVHFACHGMTEAVVRVCAFSNGVGTVEIPDECLEQTSAITAWLYRVDGTQGHTIKTITISITARTRPSKTRDIPTNFEDKYGQLIEEINEAVNALERGDVTVAKARLADSAGHATTAGNASSATYATSAGSASLKWRNLNTLFGVEKFTPESGGVYEAPLTDAQRAEYFPAGKVLLIRLSAAIGADEDYSMVHMSYVAEGQSNGIVFSDDSTLMITFDANSVCVIYSDTDAIIKFHYKVDIAVLG